MCNRKMKNLFLTLLLVLSSLTGLHAQAVMGSESGYCFKLDEEGEVVTSVSRDQRVYVLGSFANQSDKDLALRLGLEFKHVLTGETSIVVLYENSDWRSRLTLQKITFYPKNNLHNGLYQSRAVYTFIDEDIDVLTNWKALDMPEGFKSPTLEIVGEEPLAYLAEKPYVGSLNNVTEIDNAKLHITLCALSDINKVSVNGYVYEENAYLSSGYFPFEVSMNAGEVKSYTAGYKEDGWTNPGPLKVGKTYTVQIRIKANDGISQMLTPSQWSDFSFKVVENGSGIEMVETPASFKTARKVMMPDGRIRILYDGQEFGIDGKMLQ